MSVTSKGVLYLEANSVPGIRAFAGASEDVLYYWNLDRTNVAVTYRNPSDWSSEGAGGSASTLVTDVTAFGTVKNFRDLFDDTRYVIEPVAQTNSNVVILLSTLDGDASNFGPNQQVYSSVIASTPITRLSSSDAGVILAYRNPDETFTLKGFSYSGAAYTNVARVETTLSPSEVTYSTSLNSTTTICTGRENIYMSSIEANGDLNLTYLQFGVSGDQTTVEFTSLMNQTVTANAMTILSMRELQSGSPNGPFVATLFYNTSGEHRIMLTNSDAVEFKSSNLNLTSISGGPLSLVGVSASDMTANISLFTYPSKSWLGTINTDLLTLEDQSGATSLTVARVIADSQTGFTETYGTTVTMAGVDTPTGLIGTPQTVFALPYTVERSENLRFQTNTDFFVVGNVQGNSTIPVEKFGVNEVPSGVESLSGISIFLGSGSTLTFRLYNSVNDTLATTNLDVNANGGSLPSITSGRIGMAFQQTTNMVIVGSANNGQTARYSLDSLSNPTEMIFDNTLWPRADGACMAFGNFIWASQNRTGNGFGIFYAPAGVQPRLNSGQIAFTNSAVRWLWCGQRNSTLVMLINTPATGYNIANRLVKRTIQPYTVSSYNYYNKTITFAEDVSSVISVGQGIILGGIASGKADQSYTTVTNVSGSTITVDSIFFLFSPAYGSLQEVLAGFPTNDNTSSGFFQEGAISLSGDFSAGKSGIYSVHGVNEPFQGYVSSEHIYVTDVPSNNPLSDSNLYRIGLGNGVSVRIASSLNSLDDTFNNGYALAGFENAQQVTLIGTFAGLERPTETYPNPIRIQFANTASQDGATVEELDPAYFNTAGFEPISMAYPLVV